MKNIKPEAPETIVITVTPEDAKKAQPYTENTDCLLMAAIKRQMPDLCKSVGGTFTTDDRTGFRYRFNMLEILSKYDSKHEKATVTEPFDVVLTKV